MTLTLDALNSLGAQAAREAFTACCGARRWVEGMVSRRPFTTRDALLRCADEVWSGLTEPDWREAFAHHPRIGETRADADVAARSWSSGEQARAMSASETARRDLAAAQRDYERRFGHIFLICATGLSAEQILAALRARMTNEPATELRVAADEQRKITRLRLEKLVVATPVASSVS
jgi:2-oxo-4-hydroxy-4-carboxy-5-ureidoimidazoline decarboxylase